MAIFWTMVLCVYQSDNESNYNVGLSSANQTAGTFADAPVGAQMNFPRGWKMRHVLGIAFSATSVIHHKQPCNSVDNVLFISGKTFTVSYGAGTIALGVQGRIGELRAQKS